MATEPQPTSRRLSTQHLEINVWEGVRKSEVSNQSRQCKQSTWQYPCEPPSIPSPPPPPCIIY